MKTTAWLDLCRAVVRDVGRLLVELPGRGDREPIVGLGVGGDDTTAIDEAAETAVLTRLESLHRDGLDFTVVSEEVGERVFGSPDPRGLRVVVDPIDGSVNAKRGVLYFSVCIAVAEGPTMDDVVFGFVHDFGSGEEWTASRGEGARLNGKPLPAERPKEPMELLSFEATRTASVADRVPHFVGLAERVRIMGSLALSLCHLAAGRVDGVCSLKEARAVDIAAAQLLVRERGLAIDLPDAPPFGAAPLDTVGRSRVVAAATPEACARLHAALSA